ncbi:MAG TPA: glycosyltransferase family A protein [Solirubrobacter sp.]
MSPRVVIGAPVFGKAEYLRLALDSLLAQTYEDFALVVIDDRSEDDTAAVAAEYAARDPRVLVHVNERRLGMLENTREAFLRARRLFPEAEYWALGSDHDLWEPAWLETVVAELDAHPEAVMAYGRSDRIDEHGQAYQRAKPPWRFETAGLTDSRARLRSAFRGMVAGDMIYALFRVSAFEQVGPYQAVLVPDRLLLSELALHGEFRQADALLWHRRFRGLADLDRQRRAFWPAGQPAYARLPWWLTHVGAFAYAYAIQGKGEPLGIGRARGARLAVDYLEVSVRHRLWRRRRRIKNLGLRTRDAVLGPPVKAALRSERVRRLALDHVVPRLRATEETLERLTR